MTDEYYSRVYNIRKFIKAVSYKRKIAFLIVPVLFYEFYGVSVACLFELFKPRAVFNAVKRGGNFVFISRKPESLPNFIEIVFANGFKSVNVEFPEMHELLSRRGKIARP